MNAPVIAHLASMVNAILVILTETSDMLFPVHKKYKCTHTEPYANIKGAKGIMTYRPNMQTVTVF